MCTGTIDGRDSPLEITTNLTVPQGATCILIGARTSPPTVTVDGNVFVGQGATFRMNTARVKGNLSTEGANFVELVRAEVDGNTSIDGTSGTVGCGLTLPVCVSGSSFPGSTSTSQKFGNVSITNTAGRVLFESNFVAHDLTCSGNTAVQSFGNPNTVLGQEFEQCVGL